MVLAEWWFSFANSAYNNLKVNRRGDSVTVLSLPAACAINELSLLTRRIFPNTRLQEAALRGAAGGDRQAPAEIERRREGTGASAAGGRSQAVPGASPSAHGLSRRPEAGRGAEQGVIQSAFSSALLSSGL